MDKANPSRTATPLPAPGRGVPSAADAPADEARAADARPEDAHVRRTILVIAVACGLSVANLYYNQPLLADMGRGLGYADAERSGVGIVPALAQVGYAIGLALLVPLGDVLRRRRLVVVLLLAVTAALVAVALAANLPWLAGANLAVGVFTVVPQVLVPLAASLVPAERRGKAIGTVMFGLLSGILLSRTLAGFVGHRLGWRSVYWLAAGLMALLALALGRLLPDENREVASADASPGPNQLAALGTAPGAQGSAGHAAPRSYPALLRSVFDLARAQRVVRLSALNGGLLFGAFSAFWATLTFRLETPPFHYGSDVAGLFGVVAAVGAAAAPIVGRRADRTGPRPILTFASALMLLSFALYWVGGDTLLGLGAGVVMMDLAMQSAQVANQTRIYSLPAPTHSRVNTAYMTCYFVGGALGSLMGNLAWKHAGWGGVCAVGVGLSALALATHLLGKPHPAAIPPLAPAPPVPPSRASEAGEGRWVAEL